VSVPIPTRYASIGNPNPIDDFFHAFEINFLVDKQGVIGAVAGTKEELVAVTLAPFAEIA
jgi:hypothetical protein